MSGSRIYTFKESLNFHFHVSLDTDKINLTSFEEVIADPMLAHTKGVSFKNEEPVVAPMPADAKPVKQAAKSPTPAADMIGAMTKKSYKPELASDTFKTPVDGEKSTRAYFHKPFLVKGEALDAKFKGRFFAALSSTSLSPKDPGILKESIQNGIWHVGIDHDGILLAPSVFADAAMKQGVSIGRYLQGLGYATCMVFVSRGENLKDGYLGLSVSEKEGFSSNVHDWVKEPNYEAFTAHLRKALPQVRAKGAPQMSVDKVTEIDLEVFDPESGQVMSKFEGDLQIWPLAGYFPKTRIPVKNGKAKMTAMGLGLTKGEEVHCKFSGGASVGMGEVKFRIG